jgi:hypothetical protein
VFEAGALTLIFQRLIRFIGFLFIRNSIRAKIRFLLSRRRNIHSRKGFSFRKVEIGARNNAVAASIDNPRARTAPDTSVECFSACSSWLLSGEVAAERKYGLVS